MCIRSARARLQQQLVRNAGVLHAGRQAQLPRRAAQVGARVGQRGVHRMARRGRQRAPLLARVAAAEWRRSCPAVPPSGSYVPLIQRAITGGYGMNAI